MEWFHEGYDPKTNELILTSIASRRIEIEGRVTFDATNIAFGKYDATRRIRVVNETDQTLLDTIKDRVFFDVQADPDPRYSRAEFADDCPNLPWGSTCQATVYLRDQNGFNLPTSQVSNRMRARVFNLDSERDFDLKVEQKEYKNSTSNEAIVWVQAFQYGRNRVDIGVDSEDTSFAFSPIIGSGFQFQSGCGQGSKLDERANPPVCKCLDGYSLRTSPNGPVPGEPQICEPCQSCEKPGYRFASGLDDTCMCEPCPPGFFCPNPYPTNTTECPPGAFCQGGNAEPRPCPKDQYNPNSKQSRCTLCPDGTSTFERTGNTDGSFCSACPANAYCNSSALYDEFVTENDCNRRVSDFDAYQSALRYRAEGAKGPSQQGKLKYVALPREGFFRFPPLAENGLTPEDPCVSVNFLPCPGGKDTCLGGRAETNALDSDSGSIWGNQMCSAGYAGYLCMACDVGYARSDSECKPCNESKPYIYAIVAAALIFLVTLAMAWHSIVNFLREHKKQVEVRRMSLQSTSSASVTKADNDVNRLKGTTAVSVMKIGWSHLQVISLILSLNVDWHQSVTLVEHFSAMLSFSSASMTSSVMCLFDDDVEESGVSGFYRKVLIVYLFPLLCAVLFGIAWVLLAVFKRCSAYLGSWKDYYYGYQLTEMVLLFLAHILLVRTALELVVCTSETYDRTFLVADPRIECFEDAHKTWFFAGGIGGLFLYGAGIPLLSTFLVSRGNNQFLIGFFCKNFKRKTIYWESVIAARKVVLTIFVVALEKYGPSVQGLACLVTLFVALYFQLTKEPYMYRFLNQLEATGMLCSVLTLTLALYSLEFDEDVDYILNVVIALINVAFILFILYELFALGHIFVAKGGVASSSRRTSLESPLSLSELLQRTGSNKNLLVEQQGDKVEKSFDIKSCSSSVVIPSPRACQKPQLLTDSSTNQSLPGNDQDDNDDTDNSNGATCAETLVEEDQQQKHISTQDLVML